MCSIFIVSPPESGSTILVWFGQALELQPTPKLAAADPGVSRFSVMYYDPTRVDLAISDLSK